MAGGKFKEQVREKECEGVVHICHKDTVTQVCYNGNGLREDVKFYGEVNKI